MSERTFHTHTVIIGAGPAGCGASYYLSKAGIPHIILEKETFPRDKVCGDAVSGKSAFVLRKANPAWIQEAHTLTDQHLSSEGIVFIAPNGKALTIPYKGEPKPGEPAPGFTAKRIDFDHFLFSKLDRRLATVYEGVSVKSIVRNAGEVIVTFAMNGQLHTVHAEVIIGADGDKGIVRKTLFPSMAPKKSDAVGLRAYYRGITGWYDTRYIELHFLPGILPGYLWIFPLANGLANVGIGMPAGMIRKKNINLREVMLNAIATVPALKERFSEATLEGKILGWGLPMTYGKTRVSDDRVLLTGDAASLVDPFTGEGIGNALYSGMLAAEAVAGGKEAGRSDAAYFSTAYDAVLFRRLSAEIRISATLQRLSKLPWLFNAVVNKAHKSPLLRETISCMFADINMREQLRKPSFYVKILMNR